MTQEDKELLLKDLCARLPYGVICKVHLDTKGYCLRDEDKYCDDTLESVNCRKQTCTFNKSIGYDFGNFVIEEVKPYLRPMSSMTEDEKKEAKENGCIIYWDTSPEDKGLMIIASQKGFDWLNKKMFDYRKDDEGKTMIDKDLALVAPKGMYN